MVMMQPRVKMDVPLVDLKAQYRTIKSEVLEAVEGVFDSMQLFLGPNMRAFEEEFAAYCGANYCVGVGSGTDALVLALRAAGVGPGHEVITVAHTFFAGVEAIALAGATPVFVDIEPDTYCLDPRGLEAYVTARTKAIMPVHLCGQPADMSPILEVARRHNLFVLEDACQAHGASYAGRRTGTLGDAAAFSFYCSKNLGAYGEGGALVTNDANIASAARRIRDHGSDKRYEHLVIGTNARLDEVQAAILRVKLRRLDEWNARRAAIAATYDLMLADSGVITPAVGHSRSHVYHLYAIQAPDRDALKEYLAEQGIGTGIHYPIPGHKQPAAHQWTGGTLSLPVTEHVVDRVLSLPLYAEMTHDQIEYVAEHVHEFMRGRR
ncbi:MAG: DegT/DnrJ/EryC1/StrS family aminotransferase [Chloroflexota bacterium]